MMNVYINANKSFGCPPKWPQACAYFHSDVTTLNFHRCVRAIHKPAHIDMDEMSIFIILISSGMNIEATVKLANQSKNLAH